MGIGGRCILYCVDWDCCCIYRIAMYSSVNGTGSDLVGEGVGDGM